MDDNEILKKIINKGKRLPKIYYAIEGNGNAWDNYIEQRKHSYEEIQEQEQKKKEKEKVVKELAEEIAAEIEKELK